MARSDATTATIPTNLTTELATEILNRTLDELQTVDNAKKLLDAKENVGNEMLKMMQFVFPIVMQIEMDVIKEYGFPASREGIVRFAQMLRGLEKDDTELARLHSLIKAHYLPAVAVNAAGESPHDERASSN